MRNPEARDAHTIRRTLIRETVGRTLFRSEKIFDPESDGLRDFENHIEEGYGGLIVMKHFSLKDPPQTAKDIFLDSRVLSKKQVLIPTAKHQTYPGVPFVGRRLGIKMDSIVTERTVEHAQRKNKTVPKLNEGTDEFIHDAIDYLKRGQLIALAPEGTRRNHLEPYGTNSIGTLLGAAKIARAKVAVLFVDLRIAGKNEGYWDKNGLNLLTKYETRIGRCLTSDQIIAMAGSLRNVDEKVILEEMRRTAAIPRPQG